MGKYFNLDPRTMGALPAGSTSQRARAGANVIKLFTAVNYEFAFLKHRKLNTALQFYSTENVIPLCILQWSK
jgi:hypothetical protein